MIIYSIINNQCTICQLVHDYLSILSNQYNDISYIYVDNITNIVKPKDMELIEKYKTTSLPIPYVAISINGNLYQINTKTLINDIIKYKNLLNHPKTQNRLIDRLLNLKTATN